MRVSLFIVILIGILSVLPGGCSTAPETGTERADLKNDVDASMNDFKQNDPTLDNFLRRFYGYAIFPSVGKGGAGIGAAYGKGEVYTQGKRVGYVDMTQATVGPELGGETYSELIVFETGDALDRFKAGQLTFAADASAVGVKPGVAAHAQFERGIAVLVNVKGGLMGEAAIGGQKFNYQTVASAD
jgi:lipid-binding SYLF domain-containing protein